MITKRESQLLEGTCVHLEQTGRDPLRQRVRLFCQARCVKYDRKKLEEYGPKTHYHIEDGEGSLKKGGTNSLEKREHGPLKIRSQRGPKDRGNNKFFGRKASEINTKCQDILLKRRHSKRREVV